MDTSNIFISLNNICNKYHIYLVLIALVVIQLFWYFIFGVKNGGDSGFYLKGGTQLLTEGLPGFSNFKMYLKITYISFISAHLYFSDNINYIIFSQVVLHIASSLILWGIIKKYCSDFSAFILICLFSFFPYLSRWNFYILSESIAVSLSIITVWIAYKIYTERMFDILYFIPVIIVISLVRPHTSFIVFGLLLFYIYFKKSGNNLSKINVLNFLLIIFVITYVVFSFNPEVFIGSIEKLNKLYASGQIIAGAWYLDPASNHKDSSAFMSIYSVAKLGVLRVLSEIFMVRSYYSLLNNMHLILYAFIIYGLSITSFFSKKHNSFKLALLFMIFGNYFLIAITFASWDGRFSLYVLPQLWVLMALGVGLIEVKLNYNTNGSGSV